MRRHPLILLAFLLTALAPDSGSAQRTVRIESRPSCARCRIEVDRVATLGRPDDPVSLTTSTVVAVDSRGRFYAAPTFTPGVIAMYDRAGRYSRTLGRRGEGPGEFGGGIHRLAIGPGDTLHVLEANRHSVVAPGLERVVRVQMLPLLPHYFVPLPGGQYLLQNMPMSGTGAFQPLHLVGRNGRIARSFGGDGRRPRPEQRWEMLRVPALTRDGGIWAARMNAYELARWRTDGTEELRVVRDASWFSPWSGYDPRERWEHRPRPRITGVATDGSGRVWVTVIVPDEDWRPTRRPPGEVPVSRLPPPGETYDTVLEVLDVRTGRLLASRRFDQVLSPFVGTGLAYEHAEDADGNVVIQVWRVRLISQ